MIYINSDAGRIGPFWWLNSNNVDRFWMGNVPPGHKRWCICWGTCGFGRNLHVSMELIND